MHTVALLNVDKETCPDPVLKWALPDEAEKVCQRNNGTLFIPTNTTDLRKTDNLRYKIVHETKTSNVTKWRNLYVGVQYDDATNQWISDNGKPMNKMPWCHGSPQGM